MASLLRAASVSALCLATWGRETCQANSCADTEVEGYEQQELADVNVELLQTAISVGKLERKTQEFYAPAWCYTIPEYSRAGIGACNGGAGSCICMGPQVCGSWGPFPMGSWQSYTFSCCGCVPAPPPVAPVPVPAPVAVAAAPVAAPPVAAAPIAPAAAASGTNSECAAHKGCSDLKLTGTCCPAADGTYLGCCDVAALEEKVIVAQLTTQTKMLPAWCANLPETERAKAPPCLGTGPASCMCVSKSVCGEGAPAAGSWQALSTACCGCQ